MPSSLRLGIVPYINVLPLLEGLEQRFPREQWHVGVPSELACLLAKGVLDVAVVSSIEGLRRGYRHVPGVMIGCDGPVRSVALHSKVPMEKVRRLMLDRASLSSAALCRLLLREIYQIDPITTRSLTPISASYPWRTATDTDAWLVIGDTALAWEKNFPYRMDLGAAWKELTGLPFVFAAWFCRRDLALSDADAAAFAEARDRGLRSVDAILERLPPENLGLHDNLRGYLTESIRYDLDARAMEGLRRYEAMLRSSGLFDETEISDGQTS